MFSFLNKDRDKILSLDEIRQFLNNIKNINRGGCGVAAYSMYCYLEKTKQLLPDTQIIYIHREWDNDYNDNESFIQNNSGECRSATHVILKHNNKYIDSVNECTDEYIFLSDFFGTDEEFKFLHIPQYFTHSFMKKSLKEGCWNPLFDRSNVKKIEKQFRIKVLD